jgi:hypothetical protein
LVRRPVAGLPSLQNPIADIIIKMIIILMMVWRDYCALPVPPKLMAYFGLQIKDLRRLASTGDRQTIK